VNLLQHPIAFSHPLRITESGWLEHVPFGLCIVDLVRPRVLVELGTHNGVSYCAFCQAVKELELETRCYAIDTWAGDPQSGFYGDEVLTRLREHHDPLYGSFSRLVQSTFDEALDHFEDASIDLLHIDGYHTYDAVRHDWQSWLPKMSERGVVLLHDINVRESDFGAWKLWDELTPAYKHFTFTHGHGLGVVIVGQDVPGDLPDLLEARDEHLAHIR
jgi:O-antigen biosynthesis protein